MTGNAFAGDPKRHQPSVNTLDFRDGIETGIEAQDTMDAGLAHHGSMQGIPGGNTFDRVYEGSGSADFQHAEGQNVVGNRIKARKGGIDSIGPLYCRVSVQDLLEHLNIRDEPFATLYKPSEKRQCTVLVWMGSSNQIHRYVGIDEDHRRRCPVSISRSMRSISAVGNWYREASATARSLASTEMGESLRALRSAWRTHSATVIRCRLAVPCISRYSSGSRRT